MKLRPKGPGQDAAHSSQLPAPQPVQSDTGNRKGRLSDLLQEKASPGRDPAVENLLESTKDWSDYGDHGSERGEKRNDGISKQKQYSQANPRLSRTARVGKRTAQATPAEEGHRGLGPGLRRADGRARRDGGREKQAVPRLIPSLRDRFASGPGRVRGGIWRARGGLWLTLQAVPVGAGAGGRRGGLGSDDWRESTLLFHGRDHVGW